MIIGNDLMKELQIDICYSTNEIKWESASIPMRDKDISVEDIFITSQDLESAATLSDTARLHKILDAKYEKISAKDVVNLNPHLSTDEAKLLESLILKYEFLFDGTLGTWKTNPYEIELKPDAKPYHAKPFPIPKSREATLKKELQRLCNLGVLCKVN